MSGRSIPAILGKGCRFLVEVGSLPSRIYLVPIGLCCVLQLCGKSLQSCPTLCEPLDFSMPGFPVHHQLLELAQTHVHPVGDAIQPSHPLLSPSSLPSVFPSVSVFPMSQFTSGGQRIGVSASASVLPVNIQD